MSAKASTRDFHRMAFPGMRLERLLNTRHYAEHSDARRRLFVSVYGQIAMLRKRFNAYRAQRFAFFVALLKALFTKRLEHRYQVHRAFQPPKVLHTQRR
jgi:hypothetical protein